MIFNFRRAALLYLLAVLWLVPRLARAESGEPVEVEAQRLVHILSYTASDYGGAVHAGAIVSESEYEEQKALLSDAAKIAARIEPRAPADAKLDLGDRITKLRAIVDAKGSEADVGAAVAALRASLVAAFHLVEAPTAPPDPLRGRALFAQHCATCHGATGKADTERAATLNPRPASFHDPKIADPLSPFRVESTIRFGINGTAMAPLQFIPTEDRWAIAFYVMGLRHQATPDTESPTYTVAELAVRSDAQLEEELTAAGIDASRHAAILADLRRRAPYENRAGRSPLTLARSKLDRARAALNRGDRAGARNELIDAYLEGIEPAEGAINAADPSITLALEQRFLAVRGKLEGHAGVAEVDADMTGLLRDVTRAEAAIAGPVGGRSAVSTAISSGGILLREGVEAALLIAALLGIATKAGLGDRKRFVHYGWASALALGVITWIASSKLIAISGASRELIEGVTALLATVVLFYVSWSLLAKKEVARWMSFLRAQVSPGRAALSLFAVAFLAAYREAFETVLFYQALLSSNAPRGAAVGGAIGGAVALVIVVAAYSRAGRFAPPQLFFRISSYLLYGLAVVFAGQGVAALQVTGHVPVHGLAIPSLPALGLYPTVETCVAQALLVALALAGAILARGKPAGSEGGASATITRAA